MLIVHFSFKAIEKAARAYRFFSNSFSYFFLLFCLIMDIKVKEPLRWHWHNLLKYFVQGLIILAPIIITVWAVVSLFIYVDNILPNFIHSLFPVFYKPAENGEFHKIPGVGFLVIIILIVLVGWVSTSYIVSKVVEFFGHVLERTPGIKFIYTAVKDFLEAFAGEKRKFDKPVLVNVDANDVWRMGFMTQDTGNTIGLDNHVVVYVPHSYAVSGIVYIVPLERVKILSNVSSTEAMKFALSGGVTEMVHQSIS
jgi:uncharacterized membrane protein